jgi:hypothetical protein
VLINDKNLVELRNLKDTKIRGVVCSGNEDVPIATEKNEIPINCKDDINTVSANIGGTLSYLCPAGCKDVEKKKVFGAKDRKFSEHSSICRAALFIGVANDEHESVVKLKVSKVKEYVPQTGDQNGIKSEKSLDFTAKVFEFISKTKEEECPNLKTKKSSFVSFNELVKKVELKSSDPVVSFIESKEVVQYKDKTKELIKTQMLERVEAVEKLHKEEDDEPKGSKSMANSMIAIRSIKAGLKKKLAHTDGYLKYIEDSNRLISENTKKMESVYSSNMNPAK